jgi:uncharacterized protein (DUF433 family)
MKSQVYTPAQASAITELPLRAVNKLIEGDLIRPRRLRVGKEVQRLLSAEQLIYLKLEAEGVRLLRLVERRKVAKAVETFPDVDFVFISTGKAVVVQVKTAREGVAQNLLRLRKAEQMIVTDPEIMRGAPVYLGTRIPVELVANMLEQGATVEDIIEGYPALDAEKVGLAKLYMLAFPRRGRPAQRPWAKQTPIKVSRHRSTSAGQ